MNIYKVLFNTFLWGILAAIIAFQNTWLEMRMNTAIFIPAIMLIFTIILLAAKKAKYIGFKFSIINFFICSITSIIILGLKRVKIVPASIIREGLGLTSLSFDIVNLLIICILVSGIAIIYYFENKY